MRCGARPSMSMLHGGNGRLVWELSPQLSIFRPGPDLARGPGNIVWTFVSALQLTRRSLWVLPLCSRLAHLSSQPLRTPRVAQGYTSRGRSRRSGWFFLLWGRYRGWHFKKACAQRVLFNLHRKLVHPWGRLQFLGGVRTTTHFFAVSAAKPHWWVFLGLLLRRCHWRP